jgi:hypothetical protein
MSGYEITCINKNHRGVITRVGGNGWSLSTHEAIVKLSTGNIQLNLLINGEFQKVGVRGEGSDSYLVLDADGFPLHDLANLSSCGGDSFQHNQE